MKSHKIWFSVNFLSGLQALVRTTSIYAIEVFELGNYY